MSYIGENGAGFVCAGRDGKIYVKVLGEDIKKIPLNLFKTYKIGEEYKISKVAYENGIESFKFGDESRNTLWLNQDNIFITDEEQVQNIYNKLKGLTINSFEGTTIIDPTIDMGDILVVDEKPIIYQGQMSFNGRFIADIKSKISIKQRQETTTRKRSQKAINKKLQSQIDEEKLEIKQLAEEQTETSKKLTEHEQTIDGIKDTVSKNEKTITEIEKNAVVSVKILYSSSTSQTVAPTDNWSEEAPIWELGKYIWQKSVTTYINGESFESEAVCISGKDGIGIEKITPQYYLSDSNETQSGGSWKETQDAWKKDYYFWTRSKIEWTDNTTTYTTATLETGLNELNEKIETTSELLSETSSSLNLRIDEVETNVTESTTASILTLLNNGYLTAEQVEALVNGNAEDIATIKEQLTQTVTSSQMLIEITKAIEGGVSYLKNTLFTIDENGMAIATSEDEFNALYNNKGMYLYSYDELIARYDKDGAYLKNLRITGELETQNLRIIDVVVNGEKRTHIHWIGG